ncbi:MAG TPA: hydantoinase B/oxoprolinase family protein [Thermoleophilaceae bacterium]|nr:hydantoinase B/oxoprolinase family protein [Thermoleophilaceae bacterium]
MEPTQTEVPNAVEGWQPTLDPVTFEVLKNSFSTIVDQMAEQILRTCYSFVIYAKDFSSALTDHEGNTVMQGSHDVAVHVGTLHFSAKAVLEIFGDEMAPGDVYAMNDPYLGGTHFNDVRLIRPVFVDGELIAMVQCNGHWSDVGGSVPGSHDITAREHFQEGLRITPMKIWDKGVFRDDVVRMIVSNTRTPVDCEGDLHAQAEATRVAESEILRLVEKYGKDTVKTAFADVQNYVETIMRGRLAGLPDGSWEAEDYIDFDPAAGEEGLIPVKVKMTIDGNDLRYDLTGSHPVIGSALNCAFGMGFSGVVVGTKTFFPDIPLNSGFYRAMDVDLGPVGSVVNAPHPVAVTGFNAGAYEKIVNAIFELWSGLMPERALACSYNLEYLLVGGRDGRDPERNIFMWYDWMAGGWGGRNGKDGLNGTSPIFGAGLEVQPLEGQERLSPVLTTRHEFIPDSGGPGRFRGGVGVEKGAILQQAESTVMSYSCDRARSITWGIGGGLPSNPHGVWLDPDGPERHYLGAWFASMPAAKGTTFTRPSAGGGGYGDPLERDPNAVREDVADGYVTIERAAKDYGVVIRTVDEDLAAYEVDEAATLAERERIAANRLGWIEEDPESVAERYRAGELDVFDCVRQHGVVLDWGTGELLRNTTEQFRAMLARRTTAFWDAPAAAGAA